MLNTTIASIDRPDTLAQQAYQAIRKAIRNGALVRNELYSEGELAKSLGISRTPVREALIELAREHLVEIVPQRGFRLREMSLAERAEVFELRQVLEGFIVDHLARRATADDVRQLRQLIDQQSQTMDDPANFLLIDEKFHLLMPQLVGLERTYDMMVTLRGALWLIGASALAVRERTPIILKEHTAIIDAIEAHDPQEAVRAIRAHIAATAQAAKMNSEPAKAA
ncbi:MAG: GntR family transcriptional regulator [Chloroflexi bacterium]|nr:GntR family transcriptional regulator [Chloroflexota bacterium]MCI0727782.1 GntR family transcriptional regulator [Chloroflexota bacterium]